MLRKSTIRTTMIAIATAAALGVMAVPASAGDGLCAKGYVCGYEHLDFEGGMFGTQKVTANWASQGFHNRATSVSVNGGTCKYTDFYTSWNILTNSPGGGTFRLFSRTLMKTNYRDPDLRNGAGDKPGVSFDDNIDATRFTGC